MNNLPIERICPTCEQNLPIGFIHPGQIGEMIKKDDGIELTILKGGPLRIDDKTYEYVAVGRYFYTEGRLEIIDKNLVK